MATEIRSVQRREVSVTGDAANFNEGNVGTMANMYTMNDLE